MHDHDTCRDGAARVKLTDPMRDLLWTVAQHKYGWTHVSRHNGQLQVADGLVTRGLVAYSDADHRARDAHSPVVYVLPLGAVEIGRRWPVSPFALGTYDHQPGGWTPREGVAV